jgi:hypothetical protein
LELVLQLGRQVLHLSLLVELAQLELGEGRRVLLEELQQFVLQLELLGELLMLKTLELVGLLELELE